MIYSVIPMCLDLAVNQIIIWGFVYYVCCSYDRGNSFACFNSEIILFCKYQYLTVTKGHIYEHSGISLQQIFIHKLINYWCWKMIHILLCECLGGLFCKTSGRNIYFLISDIMPWYIRILFSVNDRNALTGPRFGT